MTNPLQQLQTHGQSAWYDNVDRTQFFSGQLQRMLNEDSILGVTSNPTIFAKAIRSSHIYDWQILSLVIEGKSTQEIYEALILQDIQTVADFLRPIYERTEGKEGFVSLEVSPTLAYDTEGTLAEARRFWKAVNRPNLMIKIPATPEGIPAIEKALYEGMNVNITLILSVQTYRQVVDAYLRALEARRKQGLAISRIASAASCYVSRIDVIVDALLDKRINASSDPDEQQRLKALQGTIAIANSRLLYQEFKHLFSNARFSSLERTGAQVQRVLWASTNTKNPSYRDVRYVEELIGPQTIDTMPLETIENFRDHGRVRYSIEDDIPGAKQALKELEQSGIHLDQVVEQLLGECVQSFITSFSQTLESIESKSRVHSMALMA